MMIIATAVHYTQMYQVNYKKNCVFFHKQVSKQAHEARESKSTTTTNTTKKGNIKQ